MDDRSQIADVMAAFAVHLDCDRWEELLAQFAPRVLVDFISLHGGAPQEMPREELIAGWRRVIRGYTHTTHVVGAPLIVVSGDTAHASATALALHFMKVPEMEGRHYLFVGGCYEMDFRRIGSAWRISTFRLARAWKEGNPELNGLAQQRAAAMIPSAGP